MTPPFPGTKSLSKTPRFLGLLGPAFGLFPLSDRPLFCATVLHLFCTRVISVITSTLCVKPGLLSHPQYLSCVSNRNTPTPASTPDSKGWGPAAESSGFPSCSHHELSVPFPDSRATGPTEKGPGLPALTARGRGKGQSEARRTLTARMPPGGNEAGRSSCLPHRRVVIGCELCQVCCRNLPLGPKFPSPGYGPFLGGQTGEWIGSWS